jgi:hypothetical protein
MVTIVNLTNEMQSFQKAHEVYCAALQKCECHRHKKYVYEAVDGSDFLAPRLEKWRSPQSLHVPAAPYHEVKGLPDVIASLPEIREAASGPRPRIRIIVEPVASVPVPETAAPAEKGLARSKKE